MPFYVSPEQAMKDKADYARKGIARGRSGVVLQYDGGILFVGAEPVHRAAQDQRDLRPDRVRRGRPVQRVREPAQGRGQVRRHDRLPVRPAGRDRTRAGQLVRADPRHDLHRQQQAVRGRDRGRRGRRAARPRTRSTGSRSTARSPTSTASWRWAARPTRSPRCSSSSTRTDDARRRAGRGHRGRCSGQAERRAPEISAGQLEVAVLDRGRAHRKFRRLTGAAARGAAGRGPAVPARPAAAAGQGNGSAGKGSTGERQRDGRRRPGR